MVLVRGRGNVLGESWQVCMAFAILIYVIQTWIRVSDMDTDLDVRLINIKY